MAKIKNKGSVQWYINGKKKSIAYSTTAESDTIKLFVNESATLQEAYDKINYGEKEREILKMYIDAGNTKEMMKFC